MRTQEMTPNQWSRVEDNPRQRDTEKHAHRVQPFLKDPMPQHSMVSAAELPDGRLVKLDGHTRALLWEKERIPVPPRLFVTIYPVASMDEALRMYDTYDNAIAVETTPDRLFGALRERNIRAMSSQVRRGRVSSAIKTAHALHLGRSAVGIANIDIGDAVTEWVEEIRGLDQIIVNRGTDKMHTGVHAAILLSIRKRGFHNAWRFWDLYFGPTGGEAKDPHNVLHRYLLKMKASRRTAGRESTRDILEKALAAFEHFLIGNKIANLRGVDSSTYLSSNAAVVRRQKEAA